MNAPRWGGAGAGSYRFESSSQAAARSIWAVPTVEGSAVRQVACFVRNPFSSRSCVPCLTPFDPSLV